MNAIYTSNDLSAVVDNNVLQDLHELGCLDLLFNVFDEVTIVRTIYENELLDEVKEALASYTFDIGDIKTRKGFSLFRRLVKTKAYKKLSISDRIGIAVAGEQACYCGSNDKPVRKACEDLQVRYTGVLGILGRAFAKELITKESLMDYVERLQTDATTCYIGENVVAMFLDDIDKLDS